MYGSPMRGTTPPFREFKTVCAMRRGILMVSICGLLVLFAEDKDRDFFRDGEMKISRQFHFISLLNEIAVKKYYAL
jgi:hypothetical protein